MDARFAVALAAALALVGLAGCTGSFDVNQTEPIRVQLEGAPQTVVVRDSDDEPQKVVVQTCKEKTACDVEEIEVQLSIKQVSSEPCRIHITVQDEDGNTIDERDIDVGGDTGNGSTTTTTTTTSGNGTGTNGTTTATGNSSTGGSTSAGQIVVQTFNINVKGKDNVVVLTQALQGSAQVEVNANDAKASGHSTIGSSTETTTVSGNSTTSPY